MRDTFQTATRGASASHTTSADALAHHRHRVAVATLVVAVLMGGALYASRVSERAPQVVYSAALEEVEAESGGSLLVDVNTADAEELDGLPEVGPATAEAILDYRRNNGSFGSVEDLEEVPGIGPTTIEKIKPFATV